MSRRTRARSRLLAAVAVLPLGLSACQFQGLQDVSLPGGAANGSDVYRVTVEFNDVLDLVKQSAVKVNDVPVGSVEDITLDGFVAKVKVRIKDSVVLPANASATLRQTSLLGEKFVSLGPPNDGFAQGTLSDGAVIPLSRTGRNPEVEEVFSALSLVLNGGGIEQLQTISAELNTALNGREDKVRDLLTQLNTFIGGLDAEKAQIVRAIEGFDRLSAKLAAQKQTLQVALDDIGPGIDVLTQQRENLTTLLVSLSQLGEVGTRVIQQSKDNTVADLKALQPILGNLAKAGNDLPKAMELLVTYPFPRTVDKGILGDYTNLFVTLDVNAGAIGSLTGGSPAPLPVPTALPSSLPSGIPTSVPSGIPTSVPTAVPTSAPTVLPSVGVPAARPTAPGPAPVPVPTGIPGFGGAGSRTGGLLGAPAFRSLGNLLTLGASS